MAKAKSAHAWGQTASTMALTANLARDPKKAPMTPDQFNWDPFRDDANQQTGPETIVVTPDNVGQMEKAFTT